MRLSLACVALAFVMAACASHTTHLAAARVHVYSDPRLTVVSPAVRDEATLGDTRVAADYTIDVVGGATQALTVDAVSSATHFSETRHQLGLSAAHALSAETELSGGYALSYEPDHLVHAPSLGLSQEWMQRMVRASVRYQLMVESIGRVDAPSFTASALGHRVDLEWTQIVSESLVVAGLITATAYDCSDNIGCFSNPYRYVGVNGFSGGPLAWRERHPDTRATAACALRASWSFADTGALHAGYRLSQDSWGTTAHTADTALSTEWFDHRLLARADARATVQSAASFYRAGYLGNDDAAPAYRTADAELSALWNVKLQLHLEAVLGPVRVVGEVGRMWNHYPDFTALPTRHAWVAGLGVDAEL